MEKITFNERLINGMLALSKLFEDFCKYGIFFLIVVNTMVSILLFYVLALLFSSTEVYSTCIAAIKILTAVLSLWVISEALSIIFGTIANIIAKKHKLNINKKLKDGKLQGKN